MYKILIVEDDPLIGQIVADHLKKWGYETRLAEDYNQVLNEFLDYMPQLVLLDIVLPLYNGYHWCTEIRKISKVPIVFISSSSDNMNIVMAMNMGGDDFIAKPFDLSVLLAKVQAIIRRTYAFQENRELIEHAGVILNLSETVLLINDQKIELTKNEFRIMKILMENIGKTISRDEIMTYLWDDNAFVDDNTLTVNMTRLRKKLSEAGVEKFILTRKGIGYLVEA
ncbi:MAG: two-component system, OmpR family, response regulator protein BraR/BceR [Eubacteriaceae bacterium]|jgi:DNA-binding response OmpR family regulator|nr:two-component system, OmpR family, response regulator protein BraR/BceR [Eubacteriaceae bacterium]MDK2905505.1 two-component system, OmpR family, response regulator protein BraR/BceR [Eubacteriaceae bacterium]MDK2937019.1 two-component system, OmpR family, response regulator protein BraR/BceR [Eubacteriaceae bacterium]MDN5307574.1 two-component system, OmpR family, response regulator protein BraR/BceR [Eubacteriaceae bacterium]